MKYHRPGLCATFFILMAGASIAWGGPASACHFLECPEGGTPVQEPAPPVAAAPAPIPEPNHPDDGEQGVQQQQPRGDNESCDEVGGFTYCASSVLKPQSGNFYNPGQVADGLLETAWVEGSPRQGEGEWLLVKFDGLRRVTGFRIWNGYNKNEKIFSYNSRVADLRVLFSNGKQYTSGLTIVVDSKSSIWMEVPPLGYSCGLTPSTPVHAGLTPLSPSCE